MTPKVGDVWKTPSGRLRIVRDVKVSDKYTWLTFTIAHCSWTKRSVTCYTIRELLSMGYHPTRKKYKLKTKFDRLLAEDAKLPEKKKCNFSCCDVHGIP